MNAISSRITNQGQVSIPVSVMRQMGLAPGEVITWTVCDGRLIVEKATQYSLDEVKEALHLPTAIHKTDEDIREGIRAKIRAKHASR